MCRTFGADLRSIKGYDYVKTRPTSPRCAAFKTITIPYLYAVVIGRPTPVPVLNPSCNHALSFLIPTIAIPFTLAFRPRETIDSTVRLHTSSTDKSSRSDIRHLSLALYCPSNTTLGRTRDMAPRQVTPSGLACSHCFKSKCKCVSRPDGDGCERSVSFGAFTRHVLLEHTRSHPSINAQWSSINNFGRCHRLKKECHPSDSVRKSANAQRRNNSAAKIDNLEGKVDSLVRLQCLLAQFPASSAALHSAVRGDDTLAGYEQLLPQNDSGTTPSEK